MLLATRLAALFAACVFAAGYLMPPALAQGDEDFAAEARRIQAELQEMHDIADERKSIEREISLYRSTIAYLDRCIAQWRVARTLTFATEFGCVTKSREEVVSQIILDHLQGKRTIQQVGDYIRRMPQTERLAREATLSIREAFRKKLEDANRRWADLRAPKMTHPPVTPKETTSSCNGFNGNWNTYGGQAPMTIQGSSGTYIFRGIRSTVSGTISGRTFEGTYSQPGFPEAAYRSGPFIFTLSEDGKSFTGTGADMYGNRVESWNGTCVGSLQRKF